MAVLRIELLRIELYFANVACSRRGTGSMLSAVCDWEQNKPFQGGAGM